MKRGDTVFSFRDNSKLAIPTPIGVYIRIIIGSRNN